MPLYKKPWKVDSAHNYYKFIPVERSIGKTSLPYVEASSNWELDSKTAQYRKWKYSISLPQANNWIDVGKHME